MDIGEIMAKRKKNESLADLRKRNSDKEIMDTKADEMVLDLNKRDDIYSQPDSIIIETALEKHRRPDSMVFSMRMLPEELEHFKQLAREYSVKLKKNVPYQRFIVIAALQSYPMPEEK